MISVIPILLSVGIVCGTPPPMPVPVIAPVAPVEATAIPVVYPAEESWMRQVLDESPWPAELHDEVVEIAFCESSWNPAAVGDDGLALGLMQVRTDYHAALAEKYDLLSPSDNLIAAWAIYVQAQETFRPWSCWKQEHQ